MSAEEPTAGLDRTGASPEEEPVTVADVEALIERILDAGGNDPERTFEQGELVHDLAWQARGSDPDVRVMAFWGLGEIAKDRRDSVGSAALDNLDRIAKYSAVPEEQRLASQAIRTVLRSRDN